MTSESQATQAPSHALDGREGGDSGRTSLPGGQGGFRKRVYSLPTFLAAARGLFDNLDALRAARRRGQVSRAFSEKIMLAVTQVNDCRYCSFAHTRVALHAGVSPQEIQRLMEGEIGAFPQREAVALAFAQQYAEQQGRPGEAAWRLLVKNYGLETAEDILAYIRMMTIGNLYGNTFDALLSRLKGDPAPGSRLAGELGVLFLGAAGLLPAALLYLVSRLARHPARAGL